jgi:hypothetical protein
MASTSETGHAKNIANLEELVSFVTAYGAAYNPSRAALKLPALTATLTAAQTALQNVKVTKTAYDNATNARESSFEPLRKLATRIVNALAASGASKQTQADARTVINKLNGTRSASSKEALTKATTAGEPAPKSASTSQQSYDKLIDNFAQLIQIVTAEAAYTPNENEIKVATLNTWLTTLRARNTAVANTLAALSNARIARDKALYDVASGLCTIALEVKVYVKSLYGGSSPQYKQIGGLKFTRFKRD